MKSLRCVRRLLALSIVLVCGASAAATIERFTPQGEVRAIRQATARFSEPMVKFGDKNAPSPFAVECAETGNARWIDDRHWVYDFDRDLPPGVRCSFKLKSDAKPLAGGAVTGRNSFTFSTGGPAIMRSRPGAGDESIDEEQAFLLTLNGPATPASVRRLAYCTAAGIGERIGVDIIEGATRLELLTALHRAPDATNDRLLILRCRQRLPAGADVTLVWAKGIESAQPTNGSASGSGTGRPTLVSQNQTLKFKVRPEFRVTLSCARENAKAACSPYQSMRLEFSAGVPRMLADGIRLKGPLGDARPAWGRDATDSTVTGVEFRPPFIESARYAVVLPAGFTDDLGRAPANAGMFPLQTATGEGPPLIKFAANFGIIERSQPVLPVTVRNVEPELRAALLQAGQVAPAAAQVAEVRVTEDQDMLRWMRTMALDASDEYKNREKSLLQGVAGVASKAMPIPAGGRPFEVMGIPLATPGLHIVEVASDALGAALLGKKQPMYVRSAALVTNLALHLKLGRANGAIWVTSLDEGKPVAGADVRLYDCRAKLAFRGRTDANGTVMTTVGSDQQPQCTDNFSSWFAVARTADDVTFTLSDWTRGIEPWRFNVPQGYRGDDIVASTVFDRTLLRAGETVSMKHFVRVETASGLRLPGEPRPDEVKIVHLGSEQEYTLPVKFAVRGTGETTWAIPRDAKLGAYTVSLVWKPQSPTARRGTQDTDDAARNGRTLQTGEFRVAEFRLPVMLGSLSGPKGPQVRPAEMPLSVQLGYAAGGPAAGLELRVSALLRGRYPSFPTYDAFAFGLRDADGEGSEDTETGQPLPGAQPDKLVADKVLVKLDAAGVAQVPLKALPPIERPSEIVAEATYRDPNGEEQTLRAVVPLWPAKVVAGIKTDGWARVGKTSNVTLLALGIDGRPVAGVPLSLVGDLNITQSHRRRTVGGFYAYENKSETKALGMLCSGTSDTRGFLHCSLALAESGEVVLTAKATDAAGNAAQAQSSVWVSAGGEWWFGGEDMDRMDVLPEKKTYQPGEVAKLQVRMPFRQAMAWVAVEREGVIETLLVPLSGKDPVIDLPIKGAYGPNVFVSVLAVRGRVRDVPWYSFFQWGFRAPIAWWNERREWIDVYNRGQPTALVDLAKPAFKMGIADLNVGRQQFELKVGLTADRPVYQTREIAHVRIEVKGADGKPAPAGTEVAVAAVDSALLELAPNTSWDLLSTMIRRRSYYVDTATAQMQVVGRRHFGKKALPPGGGGGRATTRELFDTLLLWKPTVLLDANGVATVDVPLNDALTTFTIVAIADAPDATVGSLFGTGKTTIRASRDLQIIAGLPPLVRESDVFRAGITLRNTTDRAMSVLINAKADGITAPLAPQTIALAAGAAREAFWNVTVPDGATAIAWQIDAVEQGGAKPASDSMKTTQKVVPAVPVTVQQATLQQVDRVLTMPVGAPAGALPGKGGLGVVLTPKIGGVPDGVRRYFEAYPFACLEQKTSKSIGLRDRAMWQAVAESIPNYLDEDGLAAYFPGSRGSDVLTAYVLAVTQQAGYPIPEATRDRMETGLIKFVDGRITRDFWSPRKDLDVRKLSAIEALSRNGKARPAMLQSITIAPNLWPTSSVIDWMLILERMAAIPDRDKRMAEAEQILRARLSMQGTKLVFSSESDDYLWWLMVSGDSNAARLIAAMVDRPGWKDDMPRLVSGLIARAQRNGAWSTTTANLWAGFALEKFSAKYETERVAGFTRVAVEDGTQAPLTQSQSWAEAPAGGRFLVPWPQGATSNATLKVTQEGAGKPWATVQSLAAIPLNAADFAGYAIEKTIEPVQQQASGTYTRGDILRVVLTIKASADMTWVAVSDPVPGGSTVLGSGLARESELATQGEKRLPTAAWPAYEERSFEGFRAYFEYAPKGTWKVQYTVRLNQDGDFALPPTRVEAMYAPEMFGALPNARMKVVP